MAVAARENRIRRFRAAGQSADALTLRRQFERVFAGLNLRPASLSPAAIVCVRTLRIAQPIGRRAWAETLDCEVQRVLATAVRPFRETVPAGATAVVFADEAELMACLARDWWRGDGGSWWWHALLGQDLSEDFVVAEFVKALPSMPAAIERLAAQGIAGVVIGGLSAGSCARLVNGLADAFAVPSTDHAAAVDRDPLRRPIEDPPVLRLRLQRRVEAALRLTPGQDVRDLALPQRRLIATALMLERDATLARMPDVAAAASRGWWPEIAVPPSESSPEPAAPAFVERASSAQVSPHAAATTPERRMMSVPDPVSGPLPSTAVADVPGISDDGRDQPHLPKPVVVDASLRELPVWATADRRLSPTHQSEDVSRSATMTFVASEMAGVLYLINVALHLGWYGDFTQPARPGLALPIGDFLALVGERACGDPLRGDPLWGLLASLAGRGPDDLPGADATPPDGMTLESWIEDLTRQLAERTAAAIGCEPELALPFLCVRAGHVWLSPTRLDVEFLLADHPLVLRLAGLDRNPGWVPAAGRIVEFRFR